MYGNNNNQAGIGMGIPQTQCEAVRAPKVRELDSIINELTVEVESYSKIVNRACSLNDKLNGARPRNDEAKVAQGTDCFKTYFASLVLRFRQLNQEMDSHIDGIDLF